MFQFCSESKNIVTHLNPFLLAINFLNFNQFDTNSFMNAPMKLIAYEKYQKSQSLK